MLIGDWNKTPKENPIIEMLAGMGAKIYTDGDATRTDSNRCIDYAVANFDMKTPHKQDFTLSDHHAIEGKITFDDYMVDEN